MKKRGTRKSFGKGVTAVTPVTYHMERRSFVNDRLLSALENIAINLERIAEALEALAEA